MTLPVLLAHVAARWAVTRTPACGWVPDESENEMTAQTPMTPERLAAARAALDEDMSQWGGEYGLELIEEVKRLQPFESIVSWRYGDTTDGRTREDMVEKAAEALYVRDFLYWNSWATEDRARVSLAADKADKTRKWARTREDARAALDAALGDQEEPA